MNRSHAKWPRCANCGHATYICQRRGCDTSGRYIELIATRAKSNALPVSRTNLTRALRACRDSLDFARLEKAPAFDFAHDVLGIVRHVNLHDGTFRDCFWPRYAKQQ